jgi:hypothetical protein
VANLVVVELLDGSWLGVDTRGADRSVERELEIWALIPAEQEEQATRSGMSWDDALGAGPLLSTLRSRTVTDAARTAFDGTVRHLTAWWSTEHRSLTTEQVADRVGQVYRSAQEPPSNRAADTQPGHPVQEEDGAWTVEIGSWMARCSADGLTTVLQPRHPAG